MVTMLSLLTPTIRWTLINDVPKTITKKHPFLLLFTITIFPRTFLCDCTFKHIFIARTASYIQRNYLINQKYLETYRVFKQKYNVNDL